MQYRWMDINYDIDGDTATFIGGCGPADLWLIVKQEEGKPDRTILVCQYKDADAYVSYQPLRTIYRAVFDLPLDEHTPGMFKPNTFVRWHGLNKTMRHHDAISIARYLAMFTPDFFTEEERRHLLGADLTPQGELE